MAVQRSTHPSPDTLKAFGLGKLDETSSGSVMSHLDQCDECRNKVAALSGDDFLDRLRQAHSRGSTPTPAKSLAEIVQGEQSPSVQTPIPNLPPELANNPHYEILRELGRGGMGVVYLARNKLMDRLEVLKVINKTLLDHPGAVERFLREIRAAAKLSHANVVGAYSAVQQGELLAFAMEFVEGQDLASLVKSQGPLPIAHACFYVQQAALGLQHAYEKQMVHRDIKPQNLILAREGKKHLVKVLDFGLAKVMRENTEDTGLTGEGQMLGTPDYIAPEQALDAAKADIRADIYSLGCTLYYLLSGRPPFSGTSLSAVLMAHQMQEAKPLNLVRPEVPEELAAVVRKMMAKSPAKRYQTPREVVQALNPFIKPGAAPKSAPELSVESVEPKPVVKKAARGDRPPAPPKPTDTEKSPPESGRRAAEPRRSEKFSDVTIGSLLGQNIPNVAPRKNKTVRKRWSAAGRTEAWKKWLIGGGIGVGVLLLALLGMWASGAIKWKTPEGTLAVEVNEPNPDVYVDGEKMRVAWSNGGKQAEIRVKPGTLKVEVKKDGFIVYGDEVTFKEGDRVIFKARLLPEIREANAKKTSAFFNEKDLTGWEGLPGYWQVKNGCIVGEPPPGQKAHTFLCSKKTYRDFDLKFRAKRVESIGNSGVQFRSRIKDFEKYTVVGPQCEIDALTFQFPPGSLVTEPTGDPLRVKPSATALAKLAKVYTDDGFNDFHIRCVGKHVTIEVNDIITADDDFPSLPDEGIIAWQLNGYSVPRSVWFRVVEFTDLSASASADGFVPLFNGKDLTGWMVNPRQREGNWRVVNGTNGNVLTGSGSDSSYLFTEHGDYKDFLLLVEARINDGGNSGVYFHAPFGLRRPANNPAFPIGYEAQINSTSRDPVKTGSLYPAFNPKLSKEQRDKLIVTDMLVKPNEWFTLEVIVQGNHIVIKLNGKTTVNFVDESNAYTTGHFALQQLNPQTEVEFRQIEIMELPAR